MRRGYYYYDFAPISPSHNCEISHFTVFIFYSSVIANFDRNDSISLIQNAPKQNIIYQSSCIFITFSLRAPGFHLRTYWNGKYEFYQYLCKTQLIIFSENHIQLILPWNLMLAVLMSKRKFEEERWLCSVLFKSLLVNTESMTSWVAVLWLKKGCRRRRIRVNVCGSSDVKDKIRVQIQMHRSTFALHSACQIKTQNVWLNQVLIPNSVSHSPQLRKLVNI